MYQLFARVYGSQQPARLLEHVPRVRPRWACPISIGVPGRDGAARGLRPLRHDVLLRAQCRHQRAAHAAPAAGGAQARRPADHLQPAARARARCASRTRRSPMEMLSPGPGTEMSSDYYQVRSGGDIAAMTGICKAVLALDDAAREAGAGAFSTTTSSRSTRTASRRSRLPARSRTGTTSSAAPGMRARRAGACRGDLCHRPSGSSPITAWA